MRTWLAFTLIWATVVYDPVAHWLWGAWEDDGDIKYGWLRDLGVLDFAGTYLARSRGSIGMEGRRSGRLGRVSVVALFILTSSLKTCPVRFHCIGGAVVHLTSGFSALAAALVIGQPCKMCVDDEAHSIPLVFIGTALLWFGWNGFNGGSALAADGIAALATVNTNISACMGMLTWMALDFRHHKASCLGAMTGTVVGLATITPAAGFVRPLSALAFGAVGSTVSFLAVRYAKRGGTHSTAS